MDRRQRKTREAIFSAFTALLSTKDFSQITVGEIIEQADIGRATFYAHFETKDSLLKELCADLFCHIFDAADGTHPKHNHIFHCEAPDCAFLHLFRHIQNNDNRILDLLASRNNTLFLDYFKAQLKTMVCQQLPRFEGRKSPRLPEDFWVDHICATFVQTLVWWISHGTRDAPEVITEYFYLAV